jgi:Ca2+:H+ antiporter
MGNILSNLRKLSLKRWFVASPVVVLLLGTSFLTGGVKYPEQAYQVTAYQMNSALLTVSAIAVLLPGAFDISINLINPDGRTLAPAYQEDVLRLSHGLSIVLATST